MHKGAYDFQIDRSKPLAAEAERAANRIYGAGLMFRGAVLGAGGNNVMADSAAKAFSLTDLSKLHSEGGQSQRLAAIIETRQAYAALAEKNTVEGDSMLHKIYAVAQDAKKNGWTPADEPARVGYVAPAPKP